MLITDEKLDELIKQDPHANTAMGVIARKRSEYSCFIAQINRIWGDLPDSLKAEHKEWSPLLTTHFNNYRGALAELFTAWVLNKVIKSREIIREPKINNNSNNGNFLTPDFYVKLKHYSFFVETFCLGKDLNERNYKSNLDILKSEIQDLKSDYLLTIVGNPTPNSAGTYQGIKLAMEMYLQHLVYDGDAFRTHLVENCGAVVCFHVMPKNNDQLPSLVGYLSSIVHGDPQIQLLTTRLETKVAKYQFPFVAFTSCVTDSINTADVFTLMETMLGREQMVILVDTNTGAKIEGVRN